jgi:trans-aconitate methyltransferase
MTDDTHEVVEQWQTLEGILRGYRQSQVLISATQLGIFRELSDGPLGADELASRVGADLEALRRLLAACVAMGLLQEDGQSYANAPLARTCLAKQGRFYMANLVAREAAFYRRWDHLTEAVRSGKQPPASLHDEQDSTWVRDFELALLDLARVSAPAIAEVLPLPAEGPARVLDVGGGHGGFSMALVRRHPQVQATVLELPAAAEVAREIVAAEGMSERVDVQVGDFQQEELGRDYNLILLFGVLGSESSEGKLALLRKAYAALAPGGAVAVRGFAYDEQPDGLQDALFSLHLLLSTAAGDSPTLEELLEALEEAGFQKAEVIQLPNWIGSRLLVARKPAP